MKNKLTAGQLAAIADYARDYDRLVAMAHHKLQDAKTVSAPVGDHIGWGAREVSGRTVFVLNSAESVRDSFWVRADAARSRGGQNGYEWVRALYFDKNEGYQIVEVK